MADVVSVLTGGTNSKTTTAEEINAPMTDLWTDGVVGTIGNTAGVAPMTGALACNAQGTPDMTVAVTAGKAYVTCTPTSQGSQRLRASIATQNATIAANSTGGTRYDWIYVAMSASGAANPAVDGTGVATITVSRSTSSSTDNGTPPTYGYHIATVTVSNGAATITNGNITDSRSVVALSATNSNTGWLTAEATPDTITALGNGLYSLVFNSIDMTDTISPGMKLKATRTSTAPTQCTSLNGTSQYYNKTSPNKTTFTVTYTCSAWVKLSSVGAVSTIVSRTSGTSGWGFRVTAGGSLDIFGWNAGNGKLTTATSLVPKGKWCFVAASMDMASGGLVYIDGLLVTSATTNLGAGATSLAQSGNLEVGSSAGAAFFPGKIAQVAVYSAVISAATLLASMNQTLTGTETSLISAYSFNASSSDLNTTTPNDLTAQGSATATNADTPFSGGSGGTTEYIYTSVITFSTNTTITASCPAGYVLPTSGGISALSYSTHSSPYGWISGDYNPYRFSAFRSGAFTNDAATFKKVTFESEEFDNNSNYDSTTNYRYTVPVAGWYQFNASYGFLTSPSTFGVLSLYKNGLEVVRGTQLNASAAAAAVVSSMLQLAVGDYIEVYVYGTNAVSMDTGASTRAKFNGFLVSKS